MSQFRFLLDFHFFTTPWQRALISLDPKLPRANRVHPGPQEQGKSICTSLFHSKRVFSGCFIVPNVILGRTGAPSTMMLLSEGPPSSKHLLRPSQASNYSFDTSRRDVPALFGHWASPSTHSSQPQMLLSRTGCCQSATLTPSIFLSEPSITLKLVGGLLYI